MSTDGVRAGLCLKEILDRINKLWYNRCMEIDILVDELTDCLKDRLSGVLHVTQICKIDIKKADYKGWKFDWSIEVQKGMSIFALRVKGDKAIQGLISTELDKENKTVRVSLAEVAPHNFGSSGKYQGVGSHLFAEAVRQSYEAGFGGHVYFVAKTNLVEHYQKTLGAKAIMSGSNIMFIEEQSAKLLLDKYFGGNKQ